MKRGMILYYFPVEEQTGRLLYESIKCGQNIYNDFNSLLDQRCSIVEWRQDLPPRLQAVNTRQSLREANRLF